MDQDRTPTDQRNTAKSRRDGQLISHRWRLDEQIGSGASGVVYRATDTKHSLPKREVAVKLACRSATDNMLEKEYNLYRLLRENKYPGGLTRPHFFGQWEDYNILVMDLHGPSFREIVEKTGRAPMKDVFNIGVKALVQIQHLHSKGYVHRDIKPGNMLCGSEDLSTIHIVDFGLAERYVYPNGKHIPYEKMQLFSGSVVFSSLRTDQGIVQSRRDDLESLGYTLVYLAKRSLPWSRVKTSNNNDILSAVSAAKQKTHLTDICSGMPSEMIKYFRYVRALGFEEEPDYDMMTDLLWKGFKKL